MVSIRNSPTSRPRLTARSVIASTLLGLDPPELATRTLVASAELLGVAAGTARVAMSRMVAAGELEATDQGYRLAGRLLERQARQDVSRTGATIAWDGTWSTAIVPGEARSAADRAELRRAMLALRHGELRDGVWMRPANLARPALPEAEAIARHQTVAVVGPLADADDVTDLVGRLWDLPGWATGATDLLDEVAPLQARVDEHDTDALAEGFVVAAAVLRHLQADPLLPAELLPPGWPGDRLRATQREFDASFRRLLRDWHLARA